MSTRARSPGYPNLSLPEAIARTRKIFEADRKNPIDRAVAAKHIGYSGLSGAADKALASLMHYGLMERAAKGEIRVSNLAVDILHPDGPQARKSALQQAAFTPDIFQTLKERFADGRASAEAVSSYLARLNFLERAIPTTVSAFMETCQFLEQENASESGGAPAPTLENPASDPPAPERKSPPPAPKGERKERVLAQNERTLTSGMLSKDANFEVIVSGHVGVKEIEMLIRKLELDKGILAEPDEVDAPEEELKQFL